MDARDHGATREKAARSLLGANLKKRMPLIQGLSAVLLLTAVCSAGRGGAGDAEPIPVLNAPMYAGFNLTLSEGTYWRYGWKYAYSTHDPRGSGSVPYHETYSGDIFVILGKPVRIQDAAAFEVILEGDLSILQPRWTHLAVRDHQLLGSADGTTLEVIFDAKRGKWEGGGLFMNFPATAARSSATAPLITDFLNTDAVIVEQEVGKNGFCHVAGHGRIRTTNPNYAVSQSEYFKEGVGFIGSLERVGWKEPRGASFRSVTRTTKVGLKETSLAHGSTRALDLPWLDDSPPKDALARAAR
jgi:hypothetical protein